jgi:hypothetical protein
MARQTLTFDEKDRRFVEAMIRHGVPAAQVLKSLAGGLGPPSIQ